MGHFWATWLVFMHITSSTKWVWESVLVALNTCDGMMVLKLVLEEGAVVAEGRKVLASSS